MTNRTSPMVRGYELGVVGGALTLVETPSSEGGSGRGEPDDAERRDRQGDRLLLAVPGDAVGPDLAADDAAAAELGRVGVEHLDPTAGRRKAQPVTVAGHRSHVGDARHRAAVT